MTSEQSIGKFYPPPLDPARHLNRDSLVKSILAQRRRLTLIEAQAGQGKSTLAAQLASRLRDTVGWYQVGPEEGDPVGFLSNLLDCLTIAIPGFTSPLLADMRRKGELFPLELPRYLDILCADLSASSARECLLVFDDLHLLEELPQSQVFLAGLIAGAPKRFRFLLVSRRPVLLGSELEALRGEELIVGNEALGLSEDEIFTLFNDLLLRPISHKEARELRRVTEGWTMGVVLASQELESGSVEDTPAALKMTGAENLAAYFNAQVLPRLGATTRRTLCRLALLTSVPLPLAEALGEPEAASLLADLAARNFFVRRLNDEGSEYVFHHLFQEALQLIAEQELTPGERAEAYRSAGHWYFERQQPEEALGYFGQAMDYAAVEMVLERDGMGLFAMNRLAIVERVLNAEPAESVSLFGWKSLFMGVIRLKENPYNALPYLIAAKNIFETQKNGVGKLLALSQLVYFHAFIDCRFNEGLPLLKEMEESFLSFADCLDVHSWIQSSICIGVGYVYFVGDIPKANIFYSNAIQRAEEHELDSFKAFATGMRGMAYCFVSDWDGLRSENDRAYLLSTNPRLNLTGKMVCSALPFNYFAISGDAERIDHELVSMKRSIGEEFVRKSAFEPFCILFEADALLGMGRIEEASELIHIGLEFGFTAANPHLYSQYLHYHAYIASINGAIAQAMSAAEESLALRAVAGGEVFVTLNELIVGATYVQMGMAPEAEEHLVKSIHHSKELGEMFLIAGAYAHLATLALQRRNSKAALVALRECLTYMKESGSVHFFSWTPQLMRPLLETAVAHGIHPEYARWLAHERLGRAILPDGISIPLMKIRTLGGLTLTVEKDSLDSAVLTPAMRELLALLLSAPKLQLTQEEVLAGLWPDIPSAKARSRFDTLLLELRKVLKNAFPGQDIGHYLTLKKGVLALQHCDLDAERFARFARKGLEHTRKKEFWQAGNSFYSASLAWQGGYLPGLRGADQVAARAAELERLHQQAALAWARNLAANGRLDESIDILSGVLDHDRTHDELVRALYHAHLKSSQPLLANKLLKQYEQALRAAEYEPEEIAEALEAVWDRE